MSSPLDGIRPITEKPPDIFETTGVKPKKPCNCTKSQCLKLYCECFARGEYCNDEFCNCKNCFNTSNYETERKRAIRQCLERNPDSFKPKINAGVAYDRAGKAIGLVDRYGHR